VPFGEPPVVEIAVLLEPGDGRRDVGPILGAGEEPVAELGLGQGAGAQRAQGVVEQRTSGQGLGLPGSHQTILTVSRPSYPPVRVTTWRHGGPLRAADLRAAVETYVAATRATPIPQPPIQRMVRYLDFCPLPFDLLLPAGPFFCGSKWPGPAAAPTRGKIPFRIA